MHILLISKNADNSKMNIHLQRSASIQPITRLKYEYKIAMTFVLLIFSPEDELAKSRRIGPLAAASGVVGFILKVGLELHPARMFSASLLMQLLHDLDAAAESTAHDDHWVAELFVGLSCDC